MELRRDSVLHTPASRGFASRSITRIAFDHGRPPEHRPGHREKLPARQRLEVIVLLSVMSWLVVCLIGAVAIAIL